MVAQATRCIFKIIMNTLPDALASTSQFKTLFFICCSITVTQRNRFDQKKIYCFYGLSPNDSYTFTLINQNERILEKQKAAVLSGYFACNCCLCQLFQELAGANLRKEPFYLLVQLGYFFGKPIRDFFNLLRRFTSRFRRISHRLNILGDIL